METLPSCGLFITGTDTGVGKTEIACLILRELGRAAVRVGAYKPVCSGADFDAAGQPAWDDIERLRTALIESSSHRTTEEVESCFNRNLICPQRFLAPLAPPLAAFAEQRNVDETLLVVGAACWQDLADVLIVEGAGGLYCPLTETKAMAALAAKLGYPVLVVARCGLGTINHTLLTLEAAKHHVLNVVGVILNQASEADNFELAESNAREIEKRGGVRVLGSVRWNGIHGLERNGTKVDVDWRRLGESWDWRPKASLI